MNRGDGGRENREKRADENTTKADMIIEVMGMYVYYVCILSPQVSSRLEPTHKVLDFW